MSRGKTASVMAWIGLVVSVIATLPFIFSVYGKLASGPAVVEGMGKVGIPMELLKPLALIEACCVIIYLVPRTAVLGAILFTGYIGGTIITHMRIGDNFLMQITLGILVWLGIYLRDGRIRELIPLRKVD
jgi:hypothetical protein